MKQVLLKTLERMGYVLVRTDAWSQWQRRIAAAEAQAVGHVVNQPGNAALHAGNLESQLADCRNQLADCASERHSLSTRIGRAEVSAQALTRQRDRLQNELAASREQLARVDTVGRIGELETENRRLAQRLADLEVYLEEIRGASKGPRYL